MITINILLTPVLTCVQKVLITNNALITLDLALVIDEAVR